MNKIFDKFISPNNGKFLEKKDENLFDGELEFDINDSIPNLTYPKNLNQIDLEAKNFYEGRADAYDKYLHLTFQTYNENEEEVRSKMIDLLDLKNDFKVLEVACGTGRDSVILDKRLSDKAELHLTDISFDMIKKAKKKLEKPNSQIFYS